MKLFTFLWKRLNRLSTYLKVILIWNALYCMAWIFVLRTPTGTTFNEFLVIFGFFAFVINVMAFFSVIISMILVKSVTGEFGENYNDREE